MRNAALVLSAAFLGALISSWIQNPREAEAAPRIEMSTGPEGSAMGIGGSAENRMDVCWILNRHKAKDGKTSLQLAAYQFTRAGVQLVDTRLLDWDLKIIQKSEVKPTVADSKKAVEKAHRQAEKDRKNKRTK